MLSGGRPEEECRSQHHNEPKLIYSCKAVENVAPLPLPDRRTRRNVITGSDVMIRKPMEGGRCLLRALPESFAPGSSHHEADVGPSARVPLDVF